MQNLWVIGMVLSLGLGCAKPKPHVRITSLQPLTHKDPTRGRCEELGEAEGLGRSEPEARAKLRDEARDVGADTVLIDEPVHKAPGGRTLLHAQLLKCGGASGAEAEAQGTPEQEAPEQSLEERLAELKGLYEQGLITQEDYDARRKELLQEL